MYYVKSEQAKAPPQRLNELKYLGAVTSLQLSYASLKLSFLLAKSRLTKSRFVKSRHWENQPRVPRGNPDGGQWTDGGGGSGGSSSSGSSFGAGHSNQFTIPNPDVGFNIGDDVFADESQWVDVAGPKGKTPQTTKPAKGKRPPLNTWHFDEDEGKLGFGKAEPNHTKERHIGWSDEDLKYRIDYERWPHLFDNNPNQLPKRIPKKIRRQSGAPYDYFGGRFVDGMIRIYNGVKNKGYYMASTFRNKEEALFFIRQTLLRNKDLVERVANGSLGDEDELVSSFSRSSGRYAEAFKGENIKYDNVRGVRVVIYHDPTSRFGVRVQTAFPVKIK